MYGFWWRLHLPRRGYFRLQSCSKDWVHPMIVAQGPRLPLVAGEHWLWPKVHTVFEQFEDSIPCSDWQPGTKCFCMACVICNALSEIPSFNLLKPYYDASCLIWMAEATEAIYTSAWSEPGIDMATATLLAEIFLIFKGYPSHSFKCQPRFGLGAIWRFSYRTRGMLLTLVNCIHIQIAWAKIVELIAQFIAVCTYIRVQ